MYINIKVRFFFNMHSVSKHYLHTCTHTQKLCIYICIYLCVCVYVCVCICVCSFWMADDL